MPCSRVVPKLEVSNNTCKPWREPLGLSIYSQSLLHTYGNQQEIERIFGAPLIWLRLPNRKACRIQYGESVDGYDKDNWSDIVAWLVEHMSRLETALRGPLEKIRPELKTADLNKGLPASM